MLNGIHAECRKQALYAECRCAECRGAVRWLNLYAIMPPSKF